MRPVSSGNHPEGDAEAVPAVDGDDGKGEVREILFAEVLARLPVPSGAARRSSS
jgi:hypothetical protein